jgi:phosphate uptake regulator
MKRKVNRVGQNTLTVSLPAKWVQKQGISAGDDLDVEEEGNNLVIIRDAGKTKINKVILVLDDLNKMLVNRYLHEFYRQGAEEIVLKFAKQKIPDYKTKTQIQIEKHVKKLVERFIGLEVVSLTKNKILLQSLMAAEEPGKIDVVQKRVYFLVKEFLDEMILALDKDFRDFHEKSYDYHDNIAKFTAYYLRLLHFSDLPDEHKTRLFGLFMVIDKMIDKVRHTSEMLDDMKKITEKVKGYLREIFDLFLQQFDLLFKKKCGACDVESLVKKRYALVHKINSERFSYEEIKVMAESKILLDTIVDFSETHIALTMERYECV